MGPINGDQPKMGPIGARIGDQAIREPKVALKELNLYFNIMNVKLCLLNQENPII